MAADICLIPWVTEGRFVNLFPRDFPSVIQMCSLRPLVDDSSTKMVEIQSIVVDQGFVKPPVACPVPRTTFKVMAISVVWRSGGERRASYTL